MSGPVLLLKADDYYSQRNNLINPTASCMPTARVMWYIANDIGFESPQNMQPEDHFMELLNSPEAVAFCRQKYPWSDGIPPNEVHGMYGAWLDERVTGKRRSDFVTSLHWSDYYKYLDNGHAIMTAGAFPTTHGHAVVFIGFQPGADVDYIADPWGDFRLDYADRHGYAIPMTESEFDRIITQFPGTSGKCGHVPI